MDADGDGPRRRKALEQVVTAILAADGRLARDARRAAFEGRDVDPDLAPYVGKVHARAWTVTDDDLGALRRAGRSEDEIFEVTVAASVGAAKARIDRVLSLLEDD